ncbi:hypothetical protein TELCIR_18820 [Teladorsagia circumcincta]|uniref:USP domain-containing protein n=1 Tax=Teladorsagia circumcincta TaxID=45464 RepID=A0A2G9TNZ2_TELCI|nr:hypothetical protein TELCIR_18820 [Teladorsagia circumcincta]
MDVEAVMNSLQHLFYTMQTTPFEDTDDNRHFTGALRLGNEQQDAQEFSLVLFDALDRNLPKHPHGEEIRQRIRERYSVSRLLSAPIVLHSRRDLKIPGLEELP